uniref:Uncharacterized protein n=1 Tax=Rhizophora mucronata TaxID=61149 RepID=A0A2P2Q1W4_RHIMU
MILKLRKSLRNYKKNLNSIVY